jgi:uncharacterized protein
VTRVRSLGIAIALGAGLASAAPIPRADAAEPAAVPALTGPVVDRAGLLSGAEADRLGQRLLRIRQAPGGPQIAVLLVRSLEGEPIEAFAIRVAEAWALGSRERDDGALLVVSVEDRAVRIEVGQGLEGDLPDAIASRIIRGVIVPAFRAGRHYDGLLTAVDAIATAAGVTELPPGGAPAMRRLPPSAGRTSLFTLLIILAVLMSILRKFSGFTVHRGSRWRHSGHFGGLGGGFGGGGFGGGGGGFSGGGASGRW